jgi:hypothetical protein
VTEDRAESVRAEIEDAAIAAFWSWWAESGRALATDDARPGAFSAASLPALGDLDHAFSTGVTCGVFTGGAAERTIVLAYDADPDSRGLGERWLAAAPAADGELDFVVYPPGSS